MMQFSDDPLSDARFAALWEHTSDGVGILEEQPAAEIGSWTQRLCFQALNPAAIAKIGLSWEDLRLLSLAEVLRMLGYAGNLPASASVGWEPSLKLRDGIHQVCLSSIGARTWLLILRRLASYEPELLMMPEIKSFARMGVWQMNFASGHIYWSDELYEMLGADKDIPPDYQRVYRQVRHVRPGDLLRQIETAVQQRENFLIDFHYLLPDGTVRYLLSHGKPYFSAEGGLAGYVGIIQDITLLRRTELALTDRDNWLRDITETIPGVIYQFQMRPDGRMSLPFMSSGLDAHLGEDAKKDAGDVPLLFTRILPEDAAVFFQNIRYSFTNLTRCYQEFRVQGADGSIGWYSSSSVPRRHEDGTVVWNGILTEISAYKVMQGQLEQINLRLKDQVQAQDTALSEAVVRMQTILDNTTQVFVLLDLEMTVLLINKAARKFAVMMLGAAMPVGIPIRQYFPEADTDIFQEAIQQVLRGEQVVLTDQYVAPLTGEKYWLRVTLSPVLDAQGQVNSILLNIFDYTERKRFEEQLSSLNDQLRRQNEMLQQYTYIISHNLRAPVANLLGLADILERDLTNVETTRQVAARVNTVSRKLDQYILDLNEILLLQHDTIHSFSTFDLKEEILELADNYQEELLKVSGDLLLTLPDTLIFYGIRTYLRSILENLVSNAIKYRSPMRALCINLKAWLEWGHLIIKVEDNGLGLDLAQHREHLFKMYTRFHAQGEGRGMGLFLVKTQVEAMSGEVAVESQPGIGSTFIVKLPYVPGA